jgi:hypothetical protein
MSQGANLCANPNILTAQEYQMDGGGQFARKLVPCPHGLANSKRISNSNAQCSVDFIYNGGIHFVRVNPRSMKAYRYLPYEQNGLTYITLNAGARLVLSGPINGCHIYVAQAGGVVTIMHVNWNQIPTDTPLNIAANSAQKLALANALRLALPGQPPMTNTLVYQPAAGVVDYHGYLGFLVARKTAHGGPWEFYVYGIGGNPSPMIQQF